MPCGLATDSKSAYLRLSRNAAVVAVVVTVTIRVISVIRGKKPLPSLRDDWVKTVWIPARRRWRAWLSLFVINRPAGGRAEFWDILIEKGTGGRSGNLAYAESLRRAVVLNRHIPSGRTLE